MAENTNDSPKPKAFDFDALSVPKVSHEEQCENARILIQEGLIEEAKKTLFHVLMERPAFGPAQVLLKQVEGIELKELFKEPRAPRKQSKPEDVDALIDSLDRDLSLGLKTEPGKEQWNGVGGLSIQDEVDLGIAYFEMGCFADALRELHRAEKRIRIEQTFLGTVGVTVVSLIAQCLIHLNRAYEARAYLEPILTEPDLKHEEKLILYYCMGRAEEDLGNENPALGWYHKILEVDPEFKDAGFRYRLLRKPVKKS